MAPCPDENTLLALVNGKLSRLLATPLQRHIESCRSCQIASTEAARTVAPGPNEPPVRATLRLVPGLVLDGRFQLEVPIGRGGAGVVWAARRLADQQPLAIKVLHGAQPDQVRRLRREARLSQWVGDPSFVTVQEVLELEPERPALIMDLLEGHDLALHLQRQGALELSDALAILLPLAAALTVLHSRQIAHRDLKPANVFLEQRAPDCRALRILDLGLARSLDLEQSTFNSSRLTSAGVVLGTPRYMAPEQLDGARDVDTRVDLWALGAVAYLMLSGRSHIEASELIGVIRALHTEPILEISRLAPRVPVSLAQLVDRSLSLEPALRPTARDWEVQLAELSKGAAANART